MFGNKDTGMHTGYSWAGQRPRDTGPDLCIVTDRTGPDGLVQCDQPADAPVHRKSYAEGGHEFTSELMAEAEDEAERDAEAAYDAVTEGRQ